MEADRWIAASVGGESWFGTRFESLWAASRPTIRSSIAREAGSPVWSPASPFPPSPLLRTRTYRRCLHAVADLSLDPAEALDAAGKH